MEEYGGLYRENKEYASQRELYSSLTDSAPDHPYHQLTGYPSDSLSEEAESPQYGLSASGNRYASQSLAERVFGAQIGQNRFSASHFERLLDERLRLYRDHQEELQEEVNDLNNRLKIIGGAYSVIPPQVTANLQRNLLKLESDQRKEQIDFWKDSMEVRAKILEITLDYQSTLNRVRILGVLGGEDV